MHRQFKDDDFQFGFEIALGGATDPGEVLATAARIRNGDSDSWVSEWLAAAERRRSQAEEALAAGRRITAVGHYRAACGHYSTALYSIAGSHEAGRETEIWTTQRDCWDRVVNLQPVPGERLSIPYEGTTLPAYFFRAPDAAPGEPRPLVVMNNGSDGATSDMWGMGGAAAAARGYHWMTFDGPGQQAALFVQDIPFRPDWEAVLTPVVDAMVGRPDVDGARMAVIGVSQAGFWVPRALAFEHRFAAAVVDPAVVDVSTSWTDHLPKHLRAQLDDGKRDAFDRNMRMGERFSGKAKALMAFRGRPYGLTSTSEFDLFRAVREYRLGDEVSQITTPLLITDPEDEQFWPGQSQRLLDLLGDRAELVRFTADEGAGRHCEPLAPALREARIFDWLDARLR